MDGWMVDGKVERDVQGEIGGQGGEDRKRKD